MSPQNKEFNFPWIPYEFPYSTLGGWPIQPLVDCKFCNVSFCTLKRWPIQPRWPSMLSAAVIGIWLCVRWLKCTIHSSMSGTRKMYPALISKRFFLPTFLLTWVDLGVSSFLSDLRDIHKILIEYPIILDGNFGYDYWMVSFFTQIWSLLWCVPRRGVFFLFYVSWLGKGHILYFFENERDAHWNLAPICPSFMP